MCMTGCSGPWRQAGAQRWLLQRMRRLRVLGKPCAGEYVVVRRLPASGQAGAGLCCSLLGPYLFEGLATVYHRHAGRGISAKR